MSWGLDLTSLQDQLQKTVAEASQFVDAAQNQFNFDELAEQEEEEEKLADYYDSLELQDEVEDEQAVVAESNFEDDPDQESHRDRHSHRAAKSSSTAPTTGARVPKGLVKKVQVLDASGFDFDDETDPKPQGVGAVGVGKDEAAAVGSGSFAVSGIETDSVGGGGGGGGTRSNGASQEQSETQSIPVEAAGIVGSMAVAEPSENSAHKASYRAGRSDSVTAAAVASAQLTKSIDQFEDWDDDDDAKPLGVAVAGADACQPQGDVSASKPRLVGVSDPDSQSLTSASASASTSVYEDRTRSTAAPHDASSGASREKPGVTANGSSSSSSSIYRSSTPPSQAPARASTPASGDADGQRSRNSSSSYSAGKEKTEKAAAGSAAARNSKAMVAAQLKQQQQKRARKKKKGGDKGVLDFFGISAAPAAAVAGASVAAGGATGSAALSGSRDEGEGGGAGAVAVVTNMALSGFFDPVGMLSDDVEAEVTAETTHGHDATAGRFQQRLGAGATGGGFDLGLGLGLTGKMFSFFDDDAGGAEESDPILQQVAYNQSNPQAASGHKSGRVQMLLTAYNFSFDEGGGVVPDYGDGDADGDSGKNEDEENQLEGMNIGRRQRGDKGDDALAMLAQGILSYLRVLWAHSQAFWECLLIATQDVRAALRGACGSVCTAANATSCVGAFAALCSSSDRQHSRLAGLGAPCSGNPLQDAPAYLESLVNPETRQYRLRQLWEFISSPRGLAALVVLLCLYSYLKFGLDLD
jgi:hypothetical protein